MSSDSSPLPFPFPFPTPPPGFPSPPPGFPSSGPFPPLDHGVLKGGFAIAEAARRYNLAWITISLFDTLATFPLEVEHILKQIWHANFTPMQLFFLMNRWGSLVMQALLYYVKFGTFSLVACSHSYFLTAFASIFVSFFCACIVSIRVWALWDRSKWLGIALIGMILTQLGLQVGPASQLHAVIPPVPGISHLQGCPGAVKGRVSGGTDTIFWVSALGFDGAILALTLYRSMLLNKRIGHRIPILRRLVRDGIVYFAIITSSNLVAVIFNIQKFNIFLQPFQAPSSLALLSIMCSRLVLSLFDKKVSPGSSNASQPKPSSNQPHPFPSTSQSTQRNTGLGWSSVRKEDEEEQDTDKGGAVRLQDFSNLNKT